MTHESHESYEAHQPVRRRKKAKRLSPALLTVPVVALGVVAMLVSCSSGGNDKPDPANEALQQRIEELQEENQALQAQVEELNEKSIKLSNRVIELMSQQKLNAEDVALIKTQLDIIEGYASELPEEAAKALNNIIEYLNSK